jgi:hypothetical protein
MKVDDASVAAPAGSLQEEDDFTTALYRAAIGPIGTATYLPIFSRFEAAGRAGLAWNWAASLLTLNWLIFRQLWAPALAYVGSLTVALVGIFGIGRLVFQMPQEVEIALLMMMGVFAFGIPGLFANAWFYGHCQARVAQSLAAHTEVPAACAALSKMASKRPRAIAVGIANVLIVAAAFGLYAEFSAHTPAHPFLPATSGLVPAAGPSLQSASGLVGVTPAMPASAVASSPMVTLVSATPASGASATAMTSIPSAAPVASAASAAAPPASGASTPMPMPPASSPVATPSVAASAPSVGPAKAASTPVVNVAPAPAKAASTENPVKVVAPKVTTKVAASKAPVAKPPTAKLAPSKSASAAAASGRESYLINVGLFAQEQNANAAYAKLIEAGLPATIQPFSTSKGPRIRVRVGPYTTQSQAEAGAANVRALGLDAIVFKP